MRRAQSLAGSFAVALVVMTAAGMAGAAPAATDLSVVVGFGGSGGLSTSTTTAAHAFGIGVIVEASSFVPEDVQVSVRLGSGVQWGANPPDAAQGCSGTAPAVCTGRTGGGSNGNFTGWAFPVTVERPGSYEITANVEGTDSDTSNNTATFRFQVLTSGGGGDTTAVKASIVKLSPARAKAGSTLVASVRVTKGGSPLRPSAVGCAASAGGTKVKGVGRAASGVASCLFKTPKSAKGKSISGSVSFRAGGSTFTKRFAARLG